MGPGQPGVMSAGQRSCGNGSTATASRPRASRTGGGGSPIHRARAGARCPTRTRARALRSSRPTSWAGAAGRWSWREKTIAGLCDLAGRGDVASVRRVLEIAALDVLGLDDSTARSTMLTGAVATATKLLEAEREEGYGWSEGQERHVRWPRRPDVSHGCSVRPSAVGRQRWRSWPGRRSRPARPGRRSGASRSQ